MTNFSDSEKPPTESMERARLVGATAKIRWQELQVFFARGSVVYVSAELDLIDVAYAMSVDDSAVMQEWIVAGRISRQLDAQAVAWAEADASVWCVVVKPWVLVQPVAGKQVIN